METQFDQGFTIYDLELQKLGLQDRIKRLEADLKLPQDTDSSEPANQVSHQLMLSRLLEIERSNLHKTNYELQKKKAGNKRYQSSET